MSSLWFLLFFSFSSWGAELAESSSLAWKISAGANLDLQTQYFPQPLPVQSSILGTIRGDASASLKVGRGLLFKARPAGQWQPLHSVEEAWLDLPEGYAQARYSLSDSLSSTTQLGWNVFSWGVTDGFNPVDVVNARRFSDPLRSEKLGAFSFVEKLDFGFLLLEGIWIPSQRKSLLPGPESRWLPREVNREQVVDNTLFRLPANHSFYFRDPQELDRALSHNFGARLAAKIFGADLSAYFFEGAATVPATGLRFTGAVASIRQGQSPDLVINADPPIGLRPIYYKNAMLGGSAVLPLGPILLRAEAAHTLPRSEGASLPVSTTESVLELEHTFNWENSALTLISLISWVDTKDPENANRSNSLARMFDRAAAIGLRYQPAEGSTLELFSLFDTRYGSQLYKFDATYALSDSWKVYAGSEIFAGEISTPIGAYRSNDRIFAGLKLSL